MTLEIFTNSASNQNNVPSVYGKDFLLSAIHNLRLAAAEMEARGIKDRNTIPSIPLNTDRDICLAFNESIYGNLPISKGFLTCKIPPGYSMHDMRALTGKIVEIYQNSMKFETDRRDIIIFLGAITLQIQGIDIVLTRNEIDNDDLRFAAKIEREYLK